MKRLNVQFKGLVQGVGFRPQVFVLAQTHHLQGWIKNTGGGVTAEVEGSATNLDLWIKSLESHIKSPAKIESLKIVEIPIQNETQLRILESTQHDFKSTSLPPDFAICQTCMQEILDPNNRRYLYPFTTCAQCGPRYSLVKGLPFDREKTSMSFFQMCEDCSNEYHSPQSRRFHSQTNSCENCGPHLELLDTNGSLIDSKNNIWPKIKEILSSEKILALKGLGGFQLVCSAINSKAVQKLRTRKHRKAKPFAVMFSNLDEVKKYCYVTKAEEALLCSPESPIVLLKKKKSSCEIALAPEIAPNNSRLGAALPTSGLHLLLMETLQTPLIVTSGNLSDEPICTDNLEALNRLKNIAENFLVHNRPIERAVDDSVAQVIFEEPQLLRRARGYSPLPFKVPPQYQKRNTLALGGLLKNTLSLQIDDQIFTSQHLGDLENEASYKAFIKTIDDFKRIYQINTPQIRCDLHPEYLSTQWAHKNSSNPQEIQHHYAHALSGMLDQNITPPFLAVVWDGSGFGSDGTLWGGEFLKITPTGFDRQGKLLPFPLPGGDKAAREPQRALAGIKFVLESESSSSPHYTQIKNKINCPWTSSVGRLFDAVAALLGFTETQSFEGESALWLQSLAENSKNHEDYYHLPFLNYVLDWRPLIYGLSADLQQKLSIEALALKFHNSLAQSILTSASQLNEQQVLLSGGVFQNKLLSEKTIRLLKNNDFLVYWHHQIPPNDGGLSLGQAAAPNLPLP